MPRRDHRRSWLIALAASALAHWALFAWLSSGGDSHEAVVASAPIEIELVQVEPPRTAAPVATGLPAGKSTSRSPGVPAGPATRTRSPVAASPSPKQGLPAEAPLNSPDAPLASTGRGDFLVPRARLDAPADGVWLELPSPGDGPRFAAPPVPRDAQELVARTVADAVGRHRVESGNVPTYFSELRAVLVIAWDVHRVVERRSRRGAAMPRSRTTIRLVQDRAGYLVRAEILAPAQDAEVAAEAISDLQRARDGLPKPPPDAIGDREQLASTWAFDYVPLPPAVTYPVTFDLVVLIDPKAIPKPTDKKLSLQSVE